MIFIVLIKSVTVFNCSELLRQIEVVQNVSSVRVKSKWLPVGTEPTVCDAVFLIVNLDV